MLIYWFVTLIFNAEKYFLTILDTIKYEYNVHCQFNVESVNRHFFSKWNKHDTDIDNVEIFLLYRLKDYR